MIGLLEHALELQEQFADWFQKVFSKWTAGSSDSDMVLLRTDQKNG